MTNNPIGWHKNATGGRAAGLVEAVTKLDQAGVRATLMVVNDAALAEWAAGLTGADHTIVYRSTVWSGAPAYHLNPAEAAIHRWHQVKSGMPPELVPLRSRLWIEPINEPDKERADYVGHFMVALATLANQEGWRVCGPAWASGNPEYDGYETAGMLAWLRYTAGHPTMAAQSVHEYSLDADDLRRWYPYLIGRFSSYLFDVCDGHGIARPPVIVTEMGWTLNDMPEPAAAMEQIRWAAGVYDAHPQIMGTCLWTLGSGDEWGDLPAKLERLIGPVTDWSLDEYRSNDMTTLTETIWTAGIASRLIAIPGPTAALVARVREANLWPISSEFDLIEGPDRWKVLQGQDPVNQDRLVTYACRVPDWANVRAVTAADNRFNWRLLAAGYQQTKIAIGHPNSALGSRIRRDGFWPLGNEVDVDYGGKTYRLRLARRNNGTDLAVYYCEVPVWSEVFVIRGPDAGPFELRSPVKEIAPRVTSGGHWRARRVYAGGRVYEHEGVDLDCYEFGRSLSIVAAADGVVEVVQRLDPGSGYGRYVRLRHDHHTGTYRTWYAHLESISGSLAVGQAVAQGQLLGIGGTTGNSSGIHLHFSVEHVGHREAGNFISGDWVDPGRYLDLGPSQPPPGTPHLPGVDVSRYQLAMDWPRTRAAGARYAFVKVSEGATWTDPLSKQNVAGALAAGLLVGPYHYFLNWVNPEAQADNFVKSMPPGLNLPPVVDFEDPSGWPADIEQRLARFIARVTSLTGISRQIVYTRASYWNQVIGSGSALAKQHLMWTAHYTTAASPAVPSGWDRWTFWQFTSSGPGPAWGAGSVHIDLNNFNGTPSDLAALTVNYKSSPLPPSGGSRVDLLPYFLPNASGHGPLFELRRTDGSQERVQVIGLPNNYFIVTKGTGGAGGRSEWEQLRWDQDWIWRGIDTSPGGGRFYVQYESPTVGLARWCPRHLAVGETWVGPGHNVQFFMKSSCQPSAMNSGRATNRTTLFAHYPSLTMNGITVNDVVYLGREDGERFWLARGLGMIGWRSAWGEAFISELHTAGSRPNNIPEDLCHFTL